MTSLAERGNDLLLGLRSLWQPALPVPQLAQHVWHAGWFQSDTHRRWRQLQLW